jgi:outer membrane lipoprotein-sorting protein
MKMEGSLAMGGMEFPGTVYSAAPNRQRVEVNVQGQQIVQAYDGETAWWINPFMGGADPQTMPAEETGPAKGQFTETYLSDYREVDGLTFPFFIESKVNGQSLQKLSVKSIQINPELDANFFTMPAKQ